MAHENPSTVTVQVHFGADQTNIKASPGDSVASLKATALNELNIVLDPAIDYFLEFEGQTIENETQTLEQLLGAHPRPHINFHVKKRPKGGEPA